MKHIANKFMEGHSQSKLQFPVFVIKWQENRKVLVLTLRNSEILNKAKFFIQLSQ